MSIFFNYRDYCKAMTYKEFQTKVLDTVKQKNHMGLIENWEKHITFIKFDKRDPERWIATIHFADEILKDNDFKYIIYDFSYSNHNNYPLFSYTECHLYSEELEAITKLTNCFNQNKNHFFDSILNDYQKEMVSLKMKDSDGDGLSDHDEIYEHGTDPFEADSDGDGITDGVEVDSGSDPLTGNSKKKSIVGNIASAKQIHDQAINKKESPIIMSKGKSCHGQKSFSR